MNKTQDIEARLMHYFASVGSTAGRTFGIRDFNTQVMMNAYSAEDREGLQPALDALIGTGVLFRVSATDYGLTPHGARLVHAAGRPTQPWCDVAREGTKCS